MPLIDELWVDGDTKLAIWQLQEHDNFFAAALPHFANMPQHPLKRKQFLAARFLLHYLIPDEPIESIIYEGQKPRFQQTSAPYFSISHSADYVAVAYHPKQPIGIDIQTYSEKIGNVKSKFLNADEQSFFNTSNLVLMTILWSIKETVYKLNNMPLNNYAQQIHIPNQRVFTEKHKTHCVKSLFMLHTPIHNAYQCNNNIVWCCSRKVQ